MIKKRIGLVFAGLVAAGCTTPIQYRYNAEVDRLCAVDGGARIFERISWPKGKFDEHGHPLTIKGKELSPSRYGPSYRVDENSVRIKGTKEGASINRYSHEIYRVSDQKLMGAFYLYDRFGGDVTGGFAPSYYNCPSPTSFSTFIKNLFQESDK